MTTMTYAPPTAEERRHQRQIADRWVEMNTILARLRWRRDGEPKPVERARLLQLRAELYLLRRGKEV